MSKLTRVQSFEAYQRRAYKRLLAAGYPPGDITMEAAIISARYRRAGALRKQAILDEGGSYCGECQVLASFSYPCPCHGRC